MQEAQAKQQVIQAGRELSVSGLIARTWGNVSCRLNEDYFAITASGRNYMTLTEEEVIRVKLSDLSYGSPIRPSSEKKIHQAVYQLKPEVGFVIHTHQDNASALSVMKADYFELDKPWEGIGNRVFCAEYGPPGTEKLCQNTKKALKKSSGNAVILKHHGALCFGRNYEEAFQAAYNLEQACGDYLKRLDARIISKNKGNTKELGQSILWSRSQVVLDFAEESRTMKPYLDDFAQIAGTKIKVLPKDQTRAEEAAARGKTVIVKGVGAFCTADTLEDAEALSMILEKNAMAFFAAGKLGGKPINRRECIKMRRHYLHQYSKLAKVREKSSGQKT